MTVGVAVMVRDKYAVRLATEQREELHHLIRVGKSSARVEVLCNVDRAMLLPSPMLLP